MAESISALGVQDVTFGRADLVRAAYRVDESTMHASWAWQSLNQLAGREDDYDPALLTLGMLVGLSEAEFLATRMGKLTGITVVNEMLAYYGLPPLMTNAEVAEAEATTDLTGSMP